jgi:hypothetical protein
LGSRKLLGGGTGLGSLWEGSGQGPDGGKLFHSELDRLASRFGVDGGRRVTPMKCQGVAGGGETIGSAGKVVRGASEEDEGRQKARSCPGDRGKGLGERLEGQDGAENVFVQLWEEYVRDETWIVPFGGKMASGRLCGQTGEQSLGSSEEELGREASKSAR